MKISIITPNFNGLSLLKKNFPQVLYAVFEYKDVDLTIVDDGSDEDEKSKLRDFILDLQKNQKIKIKLLENNKNLGFSSAVNKGAFDSDSDFLVFLNSDVIPTKDFLDRAIDDFSLNENLFGIGFMDRSIEKDKAVLRGRGVGCWKRGFLVHSKGEINKSNTLWISGGSCIVKRSIFVKFGGFDVLYNPFYWEDIDLSYITQKAGYQILFERESVVTHKHFEGSILKHYTNFYVRTIAYRNQLIFTWKNITDYNLLLSHILFLPYHFAKAFIRFDLSFFYAFFLAIVKFPDIIMKRQKQKKLYTKTDSEILKEYSRS